MDSRFSRPQSGLDRSRPSGVSDSGLAGSGANPLCGRLTGATTRDMAIRDPLVLQALEIIAVLTGTLFARAALYINAVEHPARMLLDTKSAALQWAPSYKRATFVQAPLALISFACGSLAWLSGASIWWLVAALLMGAVVRLWTRGKAGIERVLRLPCAVLFRNAVERAESLLEKR